MNTWYRKAGSASRAGFDVAVGPREAGWQHTGLYTLTLAPGESRIVTGRERAHRWLAMHPATPPFYFGIVISIVRSLPLAGC